MLFLAKNIEGKKMKIVKKSSIAVIVALGLGAPMLASGAAPIQATADSVKVRFADLDIESKEGARVLYSRLRQASRQACDLYSYTQDRSLGRIAAARDCYQGTLEKAVSKIDSKALAEIHSS